MDFDISTLSPRHKQLVEDLQSKTPEEIEKIWTIIENAEKTSPCSPDDLYCDGVSWGWWVQTVDLFRKK